MNSIVGFADDFDVVLLTATGPRIDFNGSRGGPQFPAKAGFGPPGFGNAATEVEFIGDVTQGIGVIGLATFQMSFPGWPAGTMFDVKFSYSQLNNIKVDANILAAGPFFDVPASAVPIPEPATSGMISIAAVALVGHVLHRRKPASP
jgi:hypothetical protein